MALRRRRGETDDTFDDLQPHLDWSAIVQVEPDVGVIPGEQWPEDPNRTGGRADPYASTADSIYDVEQEAASLADPAAVEAWFNGDVDKVVPSTRHRPEPIPARAPTPPSMPALGAGTRMAGPAPVLPAAQFDPNADPFDPSFYARPGSRTVSSRKPFVVPAPPKTAPVHHDAFPLPRPTRVPSSSLRAASVAAAPAAPVAVSPMTAPTPLPAPETPLASTAAPLVQPQSSPMTTTPAPPPLSRAPQPLPPVASPPNSLPRPANGSLRRVPLSPKAPGVRPRPQPPTRHGNESKPTAPTKPAEEVRWSDRRMWSTDDPTSTEPASGAYTTGVSAKPKRNKPPQAANPSVSRARTTPQESEPEGVPGAAFSRRTGTVPAVANVPFDIPHRQPDRRDDKVVDGTKAPTRSERGVDDDVFVIELSDEPWRLAQPFRVQRAADDYADDIALIDGLIIVGKPEPLHKIVVRNTRRASPKSRTTLRKEGPGAATQTKAGTSFSSRAARNEKPFSFMSLVSDFVPASRPASVSEPTHDDKRPIVASVAKSAAGTVATKTKPSVRSRRADSVIYRRDDDSPSTKKVSTARKKRPALAIRTIEDPVELLSIDHQDLQLEHYGPIVVESSLWPPDMRVDSVSRHMGAQRWPRDEGIEVWIRLPQICDALWGELARIEIASGSTVETWISLSDVDDQILHQMRLSIRVDDAESPRELLRIYREQAEAFVGYGLDGIIRRPSTQS